MKPRTKLPAYNSVAATDDVHWKLKKWREALSDRWDRRVTMSETIDWLIDNAGMPPELEEK
jgi:hypothetical protein